MIEQYVHNPSTTRDAVKVSIMYPTLTDAIIELMADLDKLASRLKNLEARVAELEEDR